MDETQEETKEDVVVSSVEFRHWRSLCKSNSSILNLLSEFVSLVSNTNNDDEEFEEYDDIDDTHVST